MQFQLRRTWWHRLCRLVLFQLVLSAVASSYAGAQALTLLGGFDATDRVATTIDESIAVGPTVLLLANNGDVTLRDKLGSVVATRSQFRFFSSVQNSGQGSFDVRVLYDQDSQRFFIVAAGNADQTSFCSPGTCVSNFFLAVSRTSIPTSLDSDSWLFYALDATLENSTPTAKWADFPSLGVNADAVVITAQMFPFGEVASVTNKTLKARVIPKAALLESGRITWTDITTFADPANGAPLLSALQPVHHFGPSDAFYVLGVSQSTCGFVVFRLQDAGTIPTMTSRTARSSLGCRQANDAPQPDGLPPLDNASGLRSPPVYRNGSLWVSRSLDDGGVAVAMWAQVDLSSWPDRSSLAARG